MNKKVPFAVIAGALAASALVAPISGAAQAPAQVESGLYFTNPEGGNGEFYSFTKWASLTPTEQSNLVLKYKAENIKIFNKVEDKLASLSATVTAESFDGAATAYTEGDIEGTFVDATTGDKIVVAPVVEEVTVESVMAINPTSVEVTFNKAVDALAKADVTVTNKENNVKQLVKSVELAKDGKTATVNFYDALKSGATYTVAVKDAGSADLVYTVGVPTTIVAETTQVFASTGTTEKVAYKVLDENGLDITSSTKDVEFQSTSPAVDKTTGVVNAGTLAGKSAFVYVVVAKEDGTELKSERITVKSEVAKAATITDFTVASSANFTAPDYKQNTKVAVTDKAKKVIVQAKDQFGKVITTEPTTFESLDLDVAVVDAATGDITPIKEGKFAVKITVGDVVKTVELEVVAESKATTVEVDKNEVNLSNETTLPATVKVDVKDQNGLVMKGVATTASATTTAGKALVDVSSVVDGKFTIKPKVGAKSGTATVEVKVNDTVKTTVVVTITEAGEVDTYELKGFKAELDKNVDPKNENKTAKLSIIPVDANGVQSGAAENAEYTVTNKKVEGPIEKVTATSFTLDASKADYKAGETYTLTTKVGSVTVATETFTVVDSTPQPELEFTATEVTNSNDNNAFDEVAAKLKATLASVEHTTAVPVGDELDVKKIHYTTTNSAIVKNVAPAAATTIAFEKDGTVDLLIGKVEIEIDDKPYTIDMNNFKLTVSSDAVDKALATAIETNLTVTPTSVATGKDAYVLTMFSGWESVTGDLAGKKAYEVLESFKVILLDGDNKVLATNELSMDKTIHDASFKVASTTSFFARTTDLTAEKGISAWSKSAFVGAKAAADADSEATPSDKVVKKVRVEIVTKAGNKAVKDSAVVTLAAAE